MFGVECSKSTTTYFGSVIMFQSARTSRKLSNRRPRSDSGSRSSGSSGSSSDDDEHPIDVGPSSPIQQKPSPWQDPSGPQPGPSIITAESTANLSTVGSSHAPSGAASAHFRSSVQRLIRMRRLAGNEPGAEPGIDPSKDSTGSEYGHIAANCKIELVDYGPSKVEFTEFDNQGLLHYLEQDLHQKRENWQRVRLVSFSLICFCDTNQLFF